MLYLIAGSTLIEIKFKNTTLKANEIHFGLVGLSIRTQSVGHKWVVCLYLKTHNSVKGDQWNGHLIAMVYFFNDSAFDSLDEYRGSSDVGLMRFACCLI